MYGGINDEYVLPMTDEYLNKLVNDLASKKKAVRMDAETALILSPHMKVATRLKKELELKTNNEKIREKAAYILGRREDINTEKILITALKDKGRKVRLQACKALGDVGDKDALEALQPLLEGRNLELSIEAKKSRERIMERRSKKREKVLSRLERRDLPHELPTLEEIARSHRAFMKDASALLSRLNEIKQERQSVKNKRLRA